MAEQVALFGPDGTDGGEETSDSQECLMRLLSTVAETFWTGSAHRPVTLGQMVIRARAPDGEVGPLRPHGVSIQRHPLTNDRMLVVANRHEGLEGVFRGSRWQGGVWSQSLGRLPGACRPNKAVKFAGVVSKGVWLPLDLVPNEREDEETSLNAPERKGDLQW